MRNTIRSYAFVFSLIAALAVPVSATTTGGGGPDDFLTKLTNAMIVVFDAVKIVMPPG